MLPIGFNAYVSRARIIGVFTPYRSLAGIVGPVKQDNRLIAANHGRKTRAIIITDSNHVICSAVSAEVLQTKIGR